MTKIPRLSKTYLAKGQKMTSTLTADQEKVKKQFVTSTPSSAAPSSSTPSPSEPTSSSRSSSPSTGRTCLTSSTSLTAPSQGPKMTSTPLAVKPKSSSLANVTSSSPKMTSTPGSLDVTSTSTECLRENQGRHELTLAESTLGFGVNLTSEECLYELPSKLDASSIEMTLDLTSTSTSIPEVDEFTRTSSDLVRFVINEVINQTVDLKVKLISKI